MEFQMLIEYENEKLIKRIRLLEEIVARLNGHLNIQDQMYEDHCISYSDVSVTVAHIKKIYCAKNHCRYLIDRSSNGDERHWCTLFHRDIVQEFRLPECTEAKVK